MDDHVRIAGSRTIKDWLHFKNSLTPGADPKSWAAAFRLYFEARLSTRYLKPIDTLRSNKTLNGEGFSILALHCSMIEFLESTLQGKNYRFVRRGDPPLGQYEYSESGKLFSAFLSTRQPFSGVFNAGLASDFYTGVRCALLHEARTKDRWIVKASGPAVVVVAGLQKTVYRNNFHQALIEFIDWYRLALPANTGLQEAFIRKFDGLCQ